MCVCFFIISVNVCRLVGCFGFNGPLRQYFSRTVSQRVGWLVGFGFNGPLRQYFSLYRAVSQREGERGERIDESKNVQTTPTRTYCKRNRPLPYCNQNCRTPRHWKFTQHHRTTRPPRLSKRGRQRRQRRERIDESKNVQTTPLAPNASAIGPCPTINQIRRTPWHWKFTQHRFTTDHPECLQDGRLEVDACTMCSMTGDELRCDLNAVAVVPVEDCLGAHIGTGSTFILTDVRGCAHGLYCRFERKEMCK